MRRALTNDEIAAKVCKLAAARAAALVRRDLVMLHQLLADEFIYTNASGHVFNKQTFLDTFVAPPDAIWHSQELMDVRVRVYGEVAVLTALIHDRVTFYGILYDSHFRTTQVYVSFNGEWQYAAGHTSPAAVPQENEQ